VPITFGEFNVSDVRPAQLFNVVADIEGQLKWDNSMSEAPSAPLDAWMGDFGVSFQRVALLGRSTDWWMFSANFLLVETKNRHPMLTFTGFFRGTAFLDLSTNTFILLRGFYS